MSYESVVLHGRDHGAATVVLPFPRLRTIYTQVRAIEEYPSVGWRFIYFISVLVRVPIARRIIGISLSSGVCRFVLDSSSGDPPWRDLLQTFDNVASIFSLGIGWISERTILRTYPAGTLYLPLKQVRIHNFYEDFSSIVIVLARKEGNAS